MIVDNLFILCLYPFTHIFHLESLQLLSLICIPLINVVPDPLGHGPNGLSVFPISNTCCHFLTACHSSTACRFLTAPHSSLPWPCLGPAFPNCLLFPTSFSCLSLLPSQLSKRFMTPLFPKISAARSSCLLVASLSLSHFTL